MKQRLVGALVLLSGGIVLWSVLFTGPAAYKVDRSTQIPPAPEVDEPAPAAPKRPVQVAEVEEEQVLPEPPVPDIAATNGDSDASDKPSSQKSASKAEEPPPPKTKAPIVDDSTGVANAWIVQVASFSNESNANKLKERLQAKGYKAYVKAAPTRSGKMLQRVFVGPELKKAVAERHKTEIEEAFKLKALLHEFKP